VFAPTEVVDSWSGDGQTKIILRAASLSEFIDLN